MPPHPTSPQAAFDSTARGYDAARRQLIPCFDQFYSSVLSLLEKGDVKSSPFRVIELGAGTGLMSAMILERFPQIYLTLVDAAQGMLEIARQRLAGHLHRVEFVLADFQESGLQTPYDAVVSALAIHHLTHIDKQRLLKRIYAAIRPDGCFINADQVRGATEEIDTTYYNNWLRQVKENGVSEEALNAALGRMRYDITVPLEDQLAWLTAAGFEDVSCVFDGDMFAVTTGVRR